eukprot:29952-Pelagococcus_subviridis.AAC.14
MDGESIGRGGAASLPATHGARHQPRARVRAEPRDVLERASRRAPAPKASRRRLVARREA